MKIVVFQMIETGFNHHASQLEVIQNHLDSGDDVTIVSCRGRTIGCDFNHDCRKLRCSVCKHQTSRGNKVFDNLIEQRYFDEIFTAEHISEAKQYTESVPLQHEALKNWHYKDFDLGMGVMSHLISLKRDAYVDLMDNESFVRKQSYIALLRYLGVREYLAKREIKKVYFLTGRRASSRSILRACQSLEIDFGAIEDGHAIDTYCVYENTTPHDIDDFHSNVLAKWDNSSFEEREERAAFFYESKVKGVAENNVLEDYTSYQKRGALPEGWDSSLRNVVIFCNSEDEFVAVGGQWKCFFYDSQLQGIEQIATLADSLPGVRFYLRMHPHLMGLENDFTRALLALDKENFVVIEPESLVSSYDLLFASCMSVTFCSTMGIEAAYWKIPSIVLSNGFYASLPGFHTPSSEEEFLQMLKNGVEASESAKESAKMFANHLLTFGTPFKYTKMGNSKRDVIFKGVHLNGNTVLRRLLSLRARLRTK